MRLLDAYDVRPFVEADVPSCAAVFRFVFNAPPWNETWAVDVAEARLRDCARTPNFTGWVATAADGDVAAFAAGYAEPYDQQRHFFLKEMCVHPAHQRRGLGRALMAHLSGELATAGVDRVYLLTARDTPARSFYAACGFYVSPKMVLMAQRFTR